MAALISTGIGTAVLKTLGSNPLEAGAFSLYEYHHLGPIEETISSDIARLGRHWNSIEITYTNTELIAVNEESSRSDPIGHDLLSYHFVICGGLVGGDGQIHSTQEWQRQLSTTPAGTWHGSDQTIHIGVIVDGEIAHATDFQIKRTEMLVKVLSRRLGIEPASIYYPDNWWLWQTSNKDA